MEVKIQIPDDVYAQLLNSNRRMRGSILLASPKEGNFSPHRYIARLLAAMTCVECGIRPEQVDWNAIWDGYDLAWPGRSLKGLAQEAAEHEASVWEEPTDEDLARAADALGWDEYGDW